MLPLKVILGHDLHPWEREVFSPIVDGLRRYFEVETTDLLPSRELKARTGGVWFVTRGWKEATRRLRDLPPDAPALITVLDTTPTQASWHSLLWEKWETPPPNHRFLCLSPFTFRFLADIRGVPKTQLHFCPLPFSPTHREPRPASGLIRPGLSVGTFSKFTAENNFHHVMTVAHYVSQKSPTVEFTLMGYGPLTKHLRNLVGSLGLEKTVKIKETTHVEEIQNLDLFLYIPVRNDHFMPLLYAAQYGLPVIANELPGIEDYILEGRTGFITPPHDTKTLGELILRMETSPELKSGIATSLRQHLTSQYPTSLAADSLARVLGARLGSAETEADKAVSLAS